MEAKTLQDQADLIRALRLRIEVFVEEQQVPPSEELDEYDEVASHAGIFQDGVCIGTGRLAYIDGHWKIGRMAVRASHRKQGVGRVLVRLLETEARRQGVTEIWLSAQTQAEGFYRNLGYLPFGTLFFEAGIEHVMMRKALA